MGIITVGLVTIGAIVSIYDDQSDQLYATNKLAEKQHKRIQELTLLSATINDSNNIQISNSGNNDVNILEIRVYDDAGVLLSKKAVTQSIPASNTAEMIVPFDIQRLIQNIRDG